MSKTRGCLPLFTELQLRPPPATPGHPLTPPLPTDLAELPNSDTMRTEFKDPDDVLNFRVFIEPDEGMYKGGTFSFTFKVPENFPFDPPKVHCEQTIYHPNIDLQGNVCLNILREDWKPVLNLNAIIVGLQVSWPFWETGVREGGREELRC